MKRPASASVAPSRKRPASAAPPKEPRSRSKSAKKRKNQRLRQTKSRARRNPDYTPHGKWGRSVAKSVWEAKKEAREAKVSALGAQDAAAAAQADATLAQQMNLETRRIAIQCEKRLDVMDQEAGFKTPPSE